MFPFSPTCYHLTWPPPVCHTPQKSRRYRPLRNSCPPMSLPLTKSVSMLAISQRDTDGELALRVASLLSQSTVTNSDHFLQTNRGSLEGGSCAKKSISRVHKVK